MNFEKKIEDDIRVIDSTNETSIITKLFNAELTVRFLSQQAVTFVLNLTN